MSVSHVFTASRHQVSRIYSLFTTYNVIIVSTTITVQKDAGIGVFERLCVLLAVVTDYVVSGVSTAIVVYICNVVVYAIVVIV